MLIKLKDHIIQHGIFFLLMLTCGHASAAQTTERYKFQYYNKESGLKQLFINSITQDNNGYLWLGTEEGIVRFDGLAFEPLRHKGEPFNKYITCMHRTQSGRISFGTILGETGFIQNGEIRELTKSSESSIIEILEYNEKQLWFITQQNNIVKLSKDLKAGKISNPLPKQILQNIYLVNGVKNLFVIKSNEGTYTGTYKPDLNEWTDIQKVVLPNNETVNEIVANKQNQSQILFISDRNFYWYNLNNSSLKHIVFESITLVEQNFSKINDYILSDDNTLLLSIMGSGVFQLNLKDTIKESDVLYYSPKSGLKQNNIKSVFRDYHGNLWFGTYGNGLVRRIESELSFYNYNAYTSNQLFALTNHGNHIFAGSKGVLLLIDKASGAVIQRYDASDKLPNDNITALHVSLNKTVWIGTESSGVYALNITTGKIERVIFSANSLENAINSITGNKHEIWVATKGALICYNFNSKEKMVYGNDKAYVFNNITKLFYDSQNRLILGTGGKTIQYLNEAHQLKILNKEAVNQYFDVLDMLEDLDGNFWFATRGNGLLRADSKIISIIRQPQGLASDYVYGVSTNHDIVYATHIGAISKLNIHSSKVEVLNENDGIESSTHFYGNALLSDAKGVYFGTSVGLLKISHIPDDALKIKKPPFINLTAIVVNGDTLSTDKPIQIKGNKNTIEFNFSAILLDAPENIKYQHWLKGFDKTWSEKTSESGMVYRDLDYGNYNFLIKVSDNKGNTNIYPQHIDFLVKKPLYLQWFFLFGMALILVGSVYVIIRIRTKGLLQIQNNLVKLLNEKSKELLTKEAILEERKRNMQALNEAKLKAEESDRFKTTLLNNMSHEVRTPLNAITGFSNVLCEGKHETEELVMYTKLINKNSDYLVRLIEDIIELSNIQTGQLNIKKETFSIGEFLDEAYKQNIESTHIHNFNTELYTLDPIDDLLQYNVKTDRHFLNIVINKAIDNALKFTTDGYVKITHAIDQNAVWIKVEDTGIGIDKKDYDLVFKAFKRVKGQREILFDGTGIGLAIVKALCDALNFEIMLDSSLNKGTTIGFKVPLANNITPAV